MMYMIIERFKDGMKPQVYERLRQEGRMLPDGLTYLDSWVEVHGNRCFQLMEAESEEPFQAWTARWSDLVDFEIVAVDLSPAQKWVPQLQGQSDLHREGNVEVDDSMRIPAFTLENWFVAAEGRCDYSLGSSDCEPLSVLDLFDADQVDEFRRVSLAYGDTAGDIRLRRAISAQYQSVPPEGIHVSAPIEAIYLFMRSVVRTGDHVVAQSPLFQPLYEVAAHIGAQISWWPPANGQTSRYEVSDLKRLVTDRTRLIVINFPHNPTGQMIPLPELQNIVELARAVGAIVLSDELFRLLERPPCETLPAICDLYERGVSLSGLSKVHGLGGLRIGWLATRMAEVLRDVEQYHFYTSGPPNMPCQWLAVRAVERTEEIASRNRKLISENLDRLRDFAKELGEGVLELNEPMASTMLMAEQHTGLTSEELCQRLLEEERVVLVPGTLVGMGNRVLRFGLGRKDFAQGLQRFATFLGRLKET